MRSMIGRLRRELRSAAFTRLAPLRGAGAGATIARGAIVRDPRFVSIGAGARVGTHAELWAFEGHPGGGRHAIILAEAADVRSFALLHAYGGSISLGRRSCVNHFCFVSGAGGVEIGDDVMIGTHTVILSSEHGLQRRGVPMTQQPMVDRPVVIEADVYVGAHVTILPGVHVATGAIVAAGAVVTADVASDVTVAGVPARPVRRRGGPQARPAVAP